MFITAKEGCYPGIFIDGRVSVDPVPLEAWEQIQSKEMQHDGTSWYTREIIDGPEKLRLGVVILSTPPRTLGEKRPLRASFLTFNRIANRYELRRTSCFRNYCPRPDHL